MFPLLTINQGSLLILAISGYVCSFLMLLNLLSRFWSQRKSQLLSSTTRKREVDQDPTCSGHHFQNPFLSSAFQLLWLVRSRGELPVLLPLTFVRPTFSIMETWHIVLLSEVEPATLKWCSPNKGTCTSLKPTPCSILPFSILNRF